MQIEISAERRAEVDELAGRMNCKATELVLRAIDAYAAQHRDDIPLMLQMSGGPDTIAAKERALESYRRMEGPAGAAERAGVTVTTIKHWVDSDPVFRQISEEAIQRCVDTVQARMFEEAQKPGPNAFRDRIAILNAYHPDFGIIRPQMLVKVLGPFLDRVIECAAAFIKEPEALECFARELGEYADGVISSQSASRRR